MNRKDGSAPVNFGNMVHENDRKFGVSIRSNHLKVDSSIARYLRMCLSENVQQVS